MQINKKMPIVISRNANIINNKVNNIVQPKDVSEKIDTLLEKSLNEMEKILNKKEDNVKTMELKIKVFNALIKASQFVLQKEALEHMKEREIVVPQDLVVGKIEPAKEKEEEYDPTE